MKNILKYLRPFATTLLLCVVISERTFGQNEPRYSPDGLLDTVSDKYGNRIPIGNIYIPTAKFGTAQIQSIIVSTCQAGYFTLHFESGSIFDLSASARTVACKVFEDLSNFLPSNIPLGSIHIHCGSPTGPGLAEASPYFVFPSNLANQNQGIIDGQVYKAIVSGVNPYLTLPLSLNNANQIYHGFVNAATTSTANPWNYNVTTTTIASNEFDMYSVLLHEAMHSLGFLSLMRFDGLSAFTPTIVNFPYYNYYHRYDLFLHDKNGNPLLAAPSASCAISNLTFAPASASVIGAGMATSTLAFSQNSTNCSEGAKYIGSTTATVYTPHYFELGSSLSHFEDMCSGPYTGTCVATYTPGNNDLYFVMANYTDPGSCYVKRHPTPEERLVLCDLGYSVNTVFGSSAVAGSSLNYSGGACSPTNIVGHNDGYFNGQFTLQVVALSSTVIPFTTLLANDSPSTGLSVSCMELVTNNATLSVGGTDFSVTVAPGGGLVVLKYVPRNSTGQIGNATFVFINFVPPGCNSCGIVNNGGFEYSTPGQNNCGFLQNSATNQPKIDCWYVYGANYSADLLTTICPSISLELGVNTQLTSPPINTVALGAGTNTNALGLMYATNGSTGAVVNSLSTPLVNGQTYQASFWVINYGSGVPGTNINSAGNPVVLSLASSTAPINPLGLATLGFPNGLNVLTSFTIASSKSWALVTNTFVYTQNASATQIVLGINTNSTQAPGTFTPSVYYCFIDEVSIIEVPGPNFSITNNTLCTSGSISDLAQFTGTTPGTFSGPGVSFDGTKYHFNSLSTLTPGIYGIAFSYSTSNCMKTLYQPVVVENCCNSPSIPSFTGQTVSGSPAFVGPMRFPNSFTVTGSLFLNGEFLISPNVSITIASGAQLNVVGAHLYGCIGMWEGIKVLDGGKVTMLQYGGVDNLVEDAHKAISISNYTNAANPILSLSNTTFNKNFISLDITDYPITNSSQASAVSLNSCVFSCRNFTFSSSSWPQTSTSDLRNSTSGTNVLHSPYDLQNAPVVHLKAPYTNQYSETAIRLENVGTTSGSTNPFTFHSVTLGNSSTSSSFLLFDAHHRFIDAKNANLSVFNSVFQNTQVRTVGNKPVIYPAVQNMCGLRNTQLAVTGIGTTLGCRFYDCHWAIYSRDAYNVEIKNSIFRSTLSKTDIASATSYPRGQHGISASGNRMNEYIIENNELINMQDGIMCQFSAASFTGDGFPSPTFMNYLNNVSIKQNTISATLSTSSTGTTSNLVRVGLWLSSAQNEPVWSTTGNGIEIEDNLFYRVCRGIGFTTINGAGLPSHIDGPRKILASNKIILEEDDFSPPSMSQWGILFVYDKGGSPSVASNSVHCLHTIEENTVSLMSANSLTNTNITLVQLTHNMGGSMYSPYVICNDISDCYRGFAFEGFSPVTYWRGNKMEALRHGMELAASGIIGQQGTSSAPSDNQWLGSWTGNFGAFVNSSNASSSKLYINPSNGSTYAIPTPSGNVAFPQWYSFPGNTLTATGSYSCGSSYNQIVPTVPSEDDYVSDKHLHIARTLLFRYLYYNPDLKNSAAHLIAFYNDFENTNIKLLADIEAELIENDCTGATALLSDLEDLNEVDQHYYDYYSLYIQSRDEDFVEFSADDIALLETLCSLCPEEDGPCIYDARNLYLAVTGELYFGEVDCSGSGARKAFRPKDIIASTTSWQLSAHPSPASNELTFKSNKRNERLKIKAFDLSGRCVLSTEVAIDHKTGILPLSLPNGVYMISAENGIDPPQFLKMIISK